MVADTHTASTLPKYRYVVAVSTKRPDVVPHPHKGQSLGQCDNGYLNYSRPPDLPDPRGLDWRVSHHRRC